MENNYTSIKIVDKSKCFSCRSCFLSCPKNAIELKENMEGFIYPEINDACIKCGICANHCPVIFPIEKEIFEQKYYCAYLKDTEKLLQSSSGGMFVAFAEKILSDGGIVFGAAYDDELNVRQIFVENKNDLQKLRGSKYVESFTGDSYEQAKRFLNVGRKVLYSGTPCQIAGLKKYLVNDYENLFTIDLICHGVPSQKLFKIYLNWLGHKNKGTIVYYGFRDKDVSGWSCGGKTKTKTKTKTIYGSCDPYYASFLRGESYRESCYTCPFANMERIGDITIGDFWGINNFYPNVNPSNGVSCCIINSKKGFLFFKDVQKSIEYFEIAKNEILFGQHNLIRPSVKPSNRETFFLGIDGNYSDYFSKIKINNLFFVFLKTTINKMIPAFLKRNIKKFLKRGSKIEQR